MAASGIVIQNSVIAPEIANSPANSDTSSSSSSSSSESDIMELECSTAVKSPTVIEVDDEDEDKKELSASSPVQVIPSQRELNGIVTLTPTPDTNLSVSVASPPSSDPEDDLHDLSGQETDIQGSIDAYAPEERITSLSDPNSRIKAVLQRSSATLWKQFDALGTEMIVTRRGRRMFPPLKVELFDLDPDKTYTLYMDMVPVDKYRYKYQNSAWVRCFEEECSPTRPYMHPDSPALGSHWMNMVINFYKLKLTNNQLDKQGHIIVNSMHKYEPRLHVVETTQVGHCQVNEAKHHMFIFPGTQFMTVTAYQNDKITQLKINNNPFAKGFRQPFSRCRGRNQQQQRIALHSTGSESSDDSICIIRNHRNMQVVDPRQEIFFVNRKRKLEQATELPSPKQVCNKDRQSPLNLTSQSNIVFPRIPHSAHGQLVTLPMFNTPVTVNGGGARTVSLVQPSSSPTLIQTPIISSTSGSPVGILQAAPSRAHSNGCFIPNGITVSNGHAPMNVIQTVAGRAIQVIPQHTLTNGTHQQIQVINTAVNLDQGRFPPHTTTTTTTAAAAAAVLSPSVRRVSPSPPTNTFNEKIFQHRFSPSSNSSPPPLVQIKTEAEVTEKSCSPPPPPHPPQSVMTIKLPQQKTSFDTTAAPIPINTFQQIYLPASATSLQQQPSRFIIIPCDAAGGINASAPGMLTALPVKSSVEPRQFSQNSFAHSLIPVQLLPSNTITTA